MIGGVLGLRRVIIAADAATGETLWTYRLGRTEVVPRQQSYTIMEFATRSDSTRKNRQESLSLTSARSHP
jgi:hypothetical protein